MWFFISPGIYPRRAPLLHFFLISFNLEQKGCLRLWSIFKGSE